MHHVALYLITEFRPKCNKLSGFRKGLERDVNIVKVCSLFAIQAALYTIVFSSNKKKKREREREGFAEIGTYIPSRKL